jgi:LCP family protein required for cell wall assembly
MKKPKAKIEKKTKKTTAKIMPPRFSSYSPQKSNALPVQKNTQHESKKPIQKNWPRHLLRVFAGLLVVIMVSGLILGIWDARNISSASKRLFGSGSIYDLLSTKQLKTDENGRVNILLIGYSVDDPGHPAPSLTDSIMLLSMDQNTHSGYMLSIPRDLYVNIPDFGYGKINEAYKDGGADLLKQIITDKFQVPVDYYVLINYAAVKETVNALGGISVNIKSTDPRGLYDPNINKHDKGPLRLTNGIHMLDGQTALNLTRARGDAYNSYGFAQADFDRTMHQRQVFTAIKDKLSWHLILNPIKNGEILDAFASNLKTNIKATEIRSIFSLFNSIPNSKLQSISLRTLNGKNYLVNYTTIYGQSALVPAAGIDNYSQIDEALSTLNK